MSALSAEGLTARYPGQPTAAPALIDVDLEVEAGERLLLLGPNGAGKSTFIRVFAGLMHATQGQAWSSASRRVGRAALVGVVSHATYLYDELTALENLRFYAELYGVREPRRAGDGAAERVGLAHLADEPVGRLSRGQQQRVTIARALLHDPPVLLLDEPDTGLDLAAFALLEELTTSSAHADLTTHNLATGLRLGTRVGVLARGRLVHQQRHRLSRRDAPALAELLEQPRADG